MSYLSLLRPLASHLGTTHLGEPPYPSAPKGYQGIKYTKSTCHACASMQAQPSQPKRHLGYTTSSYTVPPPMDAHVQLWKGVWPASIGLWTKCYPKYLARHAPKQHVLGSANPNFVYGLVTLAWCRLAYSHILHSCIVDASTFDHIWWPTSEACGHCQAACAPLLHLFGPCLSYLSLLRPLASHLVTTHLGDPPHPTAPKWYQVIKWCRA